VPILRISKRQAGRELYEAVAAKLDIDHNHPLGLIMHGAVEVDGVMQVAQVWSLRSTSDASKRSI
jgi:hypothetical protein